MPRSARARCIVCSHLVELGAPPCKCSRVFCMSHRAPESHSCGFDYRAEATARMAAALPRVVASKLDRV
jgi:predicted nucleic acid binding AN1-type Zn finger protein